MMYAFARDGGLPGHTFFHKVSNRSKTPVRTVWLVCTLSFILGLPSLGSTVAFSAATSIATIGLYVSYAIPIFLRLYYRKKFVPGPFYLDKVLGKEGNESGILGEVMAGIAVAWILVISVVFILPQLNPVGRETLNYAIVAVGIVIAYSMGFWFLSARKWYEGPVKQIRGETFFVCFFCVF